ncbi:Myxococcales GC_trans_RRR domain-containing protein [Myxococcus fulvus]|uniref:Myxococcales GC_trans_RRR domain-containing protein n=1 Tax=Myxococcus fulvus TaxID=33 RepID=A0A511SZF6_MYXFU|nr:MXAN_6652 family MXYO-CTERM-anchored protein [Myxococcus fulvus]GEN06967.1 hypothetical protein MFU01_20040 [Myxococcus fulvus]SEU02234.1 Myxococcales GC_trans_RRR domain-containing protein [Myxococcus fulvus]
MQSFLPSLKVAATLAACLVSGSAFAYATGQSNYSGKSGQTCSSGCHSRSGTAPTVTIDGPTTLNPGQTGNYTLTITGGPGVRGGYNVAVDGGEATLTAGGSDSKKLSGELTHAQPKAFANGSVSFAFTVVAPSTATTLTLFGAGNSTNGNGEDTGDASGATQLKVKVGDGGGDGGGDDDGGGCAAAGGAPLLGAALMLLGARLRRRDE